MRTTKRVSHAVLATAAPPSPPKPWSKLPLMLEQLLGPPLPSATPWPLTYPNEHHWIRDDLADLIAPQDEFGLLQLTIGEPTSDGVELLPLPLPADVRALQAVLRSFPRRG